MSCLSSRALTSWQLPGCSLAIELLLSHCGDRIGDVRILLVVGSSLLLQLSPNIRKYRDGKQASTGTG